jgi:hypothetical protein
MTDVDRILEQPTERRARSRAWTADSSGTYCVERRAQLCAHAGCSRITTERYCARHRGGHERGQ